MSKLKSLFSIENIDEKYTLKAGAFRLVLVLCALFSFLAVGFCSITNPEQLGTIIALGIAGIFSVVGLFYLPKVKNYRALSIISVFVLEFGLMPFFMLNSNVTLSSTPIWFAAGIMVMFFILDGKDFWWLFVLVIAWETYLFTQNFIWRRIEANVESPDEYFLSLLFAFLGTAIALIIVFRIQENSFAKTVEAIGRSKENEKKAGAAKSRFLANMSHEIRTPMNSIIGLSELILKDEMDDVTRNDVNVIKKSAYDLLDIIDDVLMYSKLDSGKMKLLNVDFKFDELLKSCVDSFMKAADEKGLKVRLRIDHNIPRVVNGDDIRIKQVILRLLFISVSLTENGRIMLNVKAERDEDDENVIFHCSVSDTGCGLSQADLDAVYGAYDTYDSRQNSNFKGIALKFSICRELLKMMGGSIEIRSIDGVGLESAFSFPCAIVNTEPMIEAEDSAEKRVLIYTSDIRELDVWKSVMEGFKNRPDYVNSYFAFDKAIQNRKYDIIFVPGQVYSSIQNIIQLYRIEESTYVIANPKQSYGDFDKCRIIRHPVSILAVVDVFNGTWKAENYVAQNDNIEYDGSKAKILVVDDNSVNLKVASGIFKNFKIDIDTAKSGEECIRKMEATNYHLILMDMVMPEMSGEETLKKIRSSKSKSFLDVPIIALTAQTGGNVREEILDMGFQEYLAKPIKPRYLTQVLLEFLPPGILKKEKSDEAKASIKQDLTKVENVFLYNKGLANIENNEESFYAVLNAYYKEGLVKVKEVPELVEKADLELYTTIVHGIKSSSASIGAMVVSEMFKELEDAGKSKNMDYIKEHTEAYVKAYEKILGDVKQYLVSKNKLSVKEEKEKLNLNDCAALMEALGAFDFEECDKYIEAISGKDYDDKTKETVDRIVHVYEMFDFNEAGKIIDSLLG